MSGKSKKAQQFDKELNMDGVQKFTLYQLLEVDRDASVDEIKKQYRILALKYHPDKNNNEQKAKEMFQKIAEAYEILSNPKKKQFYDINGEIGENDNNIEQFQEAYEYFRFIYPKITKQDIDQFQIKYKDSSMEQEDLINYYNKYKGDMKLLLTYIPLSGLSDVERFIDFFEQKIKSKQLAHYKKFDQTKKKVQPIKVEILNNFKIIAYDYKEESFEAEEAENNMNDLVQGILANRSQNFFYTLCDKLEAKYGIKQPLKKKKSQIQEDHELEQELNYKKKIKKSQ